MSGSAELRECLYMCVCMCVSRGSVLKCAWAAVLAGSFIYSQFFEHWACAVTDDTVMNKTDEALVPSAVWQGETENI